MKAPVQWLLEKTVKLAQLGQGIGAAGRPNSPADKAVLRKLLSSPGPLTIFDVGANRGAYLALALAKMAPLPVAIHAFEPGKAAFAELQKRFTGRPGVFLNDFALSDATGERTLFYDYAGSELSSLYPRQIRHHGIEFRCSEQVRVETLDAYCAAQGVERIGLLKLDVEGHELAVLRGASQLLARRAIGMVSFEFGGCNVDSRTFFRDFFDFFSACRMALSRVTGYGRLQPIGRYEEALEQFRTSCFVVSAD